MALVQVARGLTYIHPQHIVHLDIRPENILVRSNTRDDGDIDLHVVLADFGQALPGAASPRQVSSRTPADMFTSMVYRPLHLRRSGAMLVPVRYYFDRWAFGRVLFDLLQSPRRLRSSSGRPLRLCEAMSESYDQQALFRLRNRRLQQFALPRVGPVILECQPDKPSLADDTATANLTRLCQELRLSL